MAPSDRAGLQRSIRSVVMMGSPTMEDFALAFARLRAITDSAADCYGIEVPPQFCCCGRPCPEGMDGGMEVQLTSPALLLPGSLDKTPQR